MTQYQDVYTLWRENPECFWKEAAQGIDWSKPADKLFDPNVGVYGHWFVGGECNTCYNCLDRHIAAGRGEQAAIIHESPITGGQRILSYNELLDEVSALAAVLVDMDVKKGDRVLLYLPMIAEAAIAMLACARIGAVHSVVFGGFASKELAMRIDHAKPKVVLSASCGIEPGRVIAYKPLLDKAVELVSHKPESVIIFQREQIEANLTDDRDHDWQALTDAAKKKGYLVDCVSMAATDPLYILYTSGTTGEPKGVVRDNGGHMVALKWSMSAVYGMAPGDVYWAASDVGWVVGHSYIVYGPLLHGCTTILFEGKSVGTPDAGVFWRIIEEHQVNALFTAPTAFRAIKKEDPDGALVKRHDLSSLRALFLAGERADPDTIQWAEGMLQIPVIDNWWQTETGWPIAANPLGIELLPVKYGSPGLPMPGYDVQILDENGQALLAGEMGAICIKLPLPPGCLPTLWNKDDHFRDTYLSNFDGYYETADAGFIDDDGYISIMSRTDDIINVAGHRLSTGAMEEILSAHPAVAECAVLGISDKLKGQVPIGFVIAKDGVNMSSEQLQSECVDRVRGEIGAVAALRKVMQVVRLPKTRSGKILRGTIRKIADGDDWTMPATVDDPSIFGEIEQAMRDHAIL